MCNKKHSRIKKPTITCVIVGFFLSNKQQVSYLSNLHTIKPQMAEELNEVFTLENKEMGSLSGHKQFITFVAKWERNTQY